MRGGGAVVTLPPAGTFPTTVAEDGSVIISGITVDLPERANGQLAVSVTTGQGSVALTTAAGLTFSDADGSDGTLAFSGTEAAVNAALAHSIRFTPDAFYSGAAEVRVAATEAGSSTPPATATVELRVEPVANAPAVALSLLSGPRAAPGFESGGRLAGDDVDSGQFPQKLTVLANGNIVVSTYDLVVDPAHPSNFTREHYVTVMSPDGDILGRTAVVTDTYDGRSAPVMGISPDYWPVRVAALPDGGFAAVWGVELYNTGSRDYNQTRLQFFDAAGNPTSEEMRLAGDNLLDRGISTNTGFEAADVAVLADGTIVTAFRELHMVGSSGSGTDTTILLRAPNGALGTIALDVGLPSTDQVKLTVAGGDRFLVTFDETVGNQTTGYAQLFDSGGRALSERLALDAPVSGHDVTRLADGSFVILRPGITTHGYSVEVVSADGSSSGPVTAVAPGVPAFSNGQPAVAALADGTFVVAWSAVVQGIAGRVHLMQQFDADAHRIGGMIEVGRSPNAGAYDAEIAVTPEGRVTVLYQEQGSSVYTGDQDFIVRSFDFPLQAREDTPFRVDLSVGLTDKDGSEAISSVLLAGLPAGFTVSDGHATRSSGGHGPVDITDLDLSGPLTIHPAAGYAGTLDLAVTATSREAVGGDEAAASASLRVEILPTPNVPVGAVSDGDPTPNAVSEAAAAGDPVGITLLAVDPDASDTVGWSLSDDRFTVSPGNIVRVASGAHFDFETQQTITLVATASSSDGTSSERSFTLTVNDVAENLPPVAGPDRIYAFAAIGETFQVAEAALLRNDTDPEGDGLRIAGIGSRNGVEITFAPSVGNDMLSIAASIGTGASFTYDLSDSAGNQVAVQAAIELVSGNSLATRSFRGYTGPSVVVGGNGSEHIDLNRPGDQAFAGGGDDSVTLDLAFDQTADGGAGTDRLRAFLGSSDVVFVPAGDHRFVNFESFELYSGEGDDDLTGGGLDDYLDAGTGTDRVVAGGGNDQVFLQDDAASDFADGGAGDDWITLRLEGSTAPLVFRAAETHLINFEHFHVRGGSGADDFTGASGEDQLYGFAGNDTLRGEGGDDYLSAGGGSDALFGGDGDDVMSLEYDASDQVDGGAGNDSAGLLLGDGGVTFDLATVTNLSSIESVYVESGSGDDRLFGDGGTRPTTLSGGGGNDLLIGRGGGDVVRGGPGDDTFRYESLTDFGPGERIDDFRGWNGDLDMIDLSEIDAVTGGEDDAFAFVETATTATVANSITWSQKTSYQTTVRGDVNGDAIADFSFEVDSSPPSLQADFFIL